jgi:hypothetical protein
MASMPLAEIKKDEILKPIPTVILTTSDGRNGRRKMLRTPSKQLSL